MADRNRLSQYDNYQQDSDQRYNRQSEQFSSYDDDQFGDDRYGSQDRSYGNRSQFGGRNGSMNDQSYGRRSQYADYNQDSNYRGSDYDPMGDYDRSSMNRGYTSYRNDQEHQFFRPDDFGGEDYTRGTYASGGYRGGGNYSGGYSGRSRGGSGSQNYNRFGEGQDRGFIAKASDEIASWFGDDDAERRRREIDHSGRGPSNYTRSNERLLEDACERLTHDRYVDASKINVTADNNEVTLDGTVSSRQAKRRAEDCVHDISGVKHVQNNLRVDDDWSSSNNYSNDRTYSESNRTTQTDTTTS
ncbi:BON domain-containing protein [Erythrobacter litoralis]|uniref:BON domain-containing protein n=1 Tax=Erythrobacter litoralis TaxID=39960 RepID=UPI002435B135|nr:BON domain-containing protein [Erythrobacter litoralis]